MLGTFGISQVVTVLTLRSNTHKVNIAIRMIPYLDGMCIMLKTLILLNTFSPESGKMFFSDT